MSRLVELLGEAQELGAIGPAPIQEHVRHAAAFLDAAALDSPTPRLLDLGSGGGLPGLVLAELLPTARCTLLDGRVERARLLRDYVRRLGWEGRVEVLGERAELAARGAHREAFDLVVARSFGRPAVTAECAAPFLRVGGLLVVSEPPAGAREETRWPTAGCALLGLVPLDVPALPWSFARLEQRSSCPERFPRRVGIPAKRPLF